MHWFEKYLSSLYNKDSFNVGQLFSLSVLIQAGYLSKKRERKKKFGECCSATEVLYIVDGGLEQTPKQKKTWQYDGRWSFYPSIFWWYSKIS